MAVNGREKRKMRRPKKRPVPKNNKSERLDCGESDALDPCWRKQIDGVEGRHCLPNPELLLSMPANAFVPYVRAAVKLLTTVPDTADEGCITQTLQLQQEIVEFTLRRLLRDRCENGTILPKPRDLQIDVVLRLVFSCENTILVAQTGFGKSLVFEAYTLLTGRTTIMVVPLTNLGSQQLRSIQRVPGARPVLVSKDTRANDNDLFTKIKNGGYTHILMGPEQLLCPKFRDVLRNPEFRAKLGLFAVDEAHCVLMWSAFRAQYAQLHQIREHLPSHVVSFACTATMDVNTEERIIQHLGFNFCQSRNPQTGDVKQWDKTTGVIRTSIDRPEISISRVRLPSCDAVNGLRFALHEVVQAKSRQELSVLPKMVIFANSRKKVHTVCDYLRNCLLKSKLHGYTEKQIRDTVTTFTSHTADLDRQWRLTELMKEDSQIRILVATTSFGMEMDVPDVEVVIQYEVIKQDTSVVGGSSVLIVCDLLQRIGRAARGRNRKARAYICINDSYWIPRNVTPNTEPGISASMNRNSRRSRQTEFEEDLRSVSGTETSEDEGYLGLAGPETHIADQEVDTVSFSWSEFAQMETCLRKYLLTFLGEDRVPEERMRPPVPPEECCNVCNPEDLSVEGSFQLKEQEAKAPTKYSQRWLVLQYVQAWAKEITRKWIGSGDLIFEPPI